MKATLSAHCGRSENKNNEAMNSSSSWQPYLVAFSVLFQSGKPAFAQCNKFFERCFTIMQTEVRRGVKWKGEAPPTFHSVPRYNLCEPPALFHFLTVILETCIRFFDPFCKTLPDEKRWIVWWAPLSAPLHFALSSPSLTCETVLSIERPFTPHHTFCLCRLTHAVGNHSSHFHDSFRLTTQFQLLAIAK